VLRITTTVKPKKKNQSDWYKKRNIDSQAGRRHQEIAVKTIFFFTFDFNFLLHAGQVKVPLPHLFIILKYGMLFFLQCGQIILLVLLFPKGTILKLFHCFFILKYESLIPKNQSDY